MALSTFPNTGMTGPTARDRRDARPDTVRRAVSFIEDNAHRDITAADIADAASVTIRATQIAFHRHLDTTPMTYLRRVRLANAHHELEVGHDEATTVSAVARRWGFAKPGRFAAQFGAVYGQMPGEVLHTD